MQRPPHIRCTAKGRLSQKKGGLCLQFGDNCRYNKNGKGARRMAHILVAEDEVDYLLERLEEQIEKVTARAKARKG